VRGKRAAMRLTRSFVCSLWLFGALLVGCNQYRVNQTSLVPAAILTPPVAFEPGLDVSATGSYVVGSAGRTSEGDDASLWISRGSLVSALEYSGRVVGGRMQFFHGFNAGASRVTTQSLGKPSGLVWGAGPSLLFRAFGDHPGHRLNFDVGTLFVVAPSRVRAECVDCMEGDLDQSGTFRDRSMALMLTTGVQHRVLIDEELRVVWSLNLQTSVTNRYELDGNIPGRSKVNMGIVHPTIAVGVEWSPTWWATVQPGLAWIAPPSPSIYLPAVLLSLRFNPSSDRSELEEVVPETGLRVLDSNLASLSK